MAWTAATCAPSRSRRTVKFVLIIMRSDNDGEGGITALVALLTRDRRCGSGAPLILLGVAGAALFFGDGAITPAISVLSAVEGLHNTSPRLSDWIVPLSLGILATLVVLQRRGTGAAGRLVGPVMLVWFTVIGVLGAVAVAVHPGGAARRVVPVAAGAVVFVLLTIWQRGCTLALAALREREMPIGAFLAAIRARPPQRVAGTAVYLTAADEGAPSPLTRNLERNTSSTVTSSWSRR